MAITAMIVATIAAYVFTLKKTSRVQCATKRAGTGAAFLRQTGARKIHSKDKRKQSAVKLSGSAQREPRLPLPTRTASKGPNMPTIQFTVPGEPQGYYACGKFPNYARRSKYHAYCEKVRLYAAQAGVKLPLVATKNSTLSIHVRPVFSSGVHCDPGNVQKGICDALFYSKQKAKGSGDKWTGGSFPPPIYCDIPRTEVQIQFFADSTSDGLLPSAGDASDTAKVPGAAVNGQDCVPVAKETKRADTPRRKPRPGDFWGDKA